MIMKGQFGTLDNPMDFWAKDYTSEGVSVIELSNGDRVLGQITGAGCILGKLHC